MSDPRDEMEMAILKNEFRMLYRDLGLNECLCVMNDILAGATLLGEVIVEELAREKSEESGS